MYSKAALIASLVASGAFAQVPPEPSKETQTKDSDQQKVVCRKDEQIGTRLGARRVCMTVREWQEFKEGGREMTEKIQSGTWGRDSQ